MSVYRWVNQRSIGLSSNNCNEKYFTDFRSVQYHLWKSLYRKCSNANQSNPGYNGVFGLKYSPDGKLIVAACEKDAVVMVDPITSKVVYCRENVHTKRCNTVTFIDDRLFFTCSDDANISLWDIRNMKEEVIKLKGHNSWVKNVEYDKSSKKVVSSGFDDQILLWDINNLSPTGECNPRRILKCANLMRMRLSPDGKSMYISSVHTADLVAIHNLDLETLENDINEIQFNIVHGEHSISFNKQSRNVDSKDRYDQQSMPVTERNHLELYYGYNDNEDKNGHISIFCRAIDVHPESLAVVIRYDRLSNPFQCPFGNTHHLRDFTTVHNTWSFYDGKNYGNNAWDNSNYNTPSDLPLARGLPTNIVQEEGRENSEYIQEICFSPCGRLIASPFGYGIRISSFDSKLSDYRRHISSRLHETHTWDEDSDRVLPCYKDINTEPLHDVAYCFGHRSMVLSACFSPTLMQVATGSKDGHIVLYNTVL